MFPTQDNTSITTSTSSGKTLQFDFDAGDFVVKDGKVVTLTGLEGLKMWIIKVLKTERNKFKIYDTKNTEKYGISLLDLITGDYPVAFKQAQIQTAITETLLTNSEITSVTNFTFSQDMEELTVSFTVNNIYESTSVTVNGNEVSI